MAPTFRHGKSSVLFFSTGGSTSGAIRLSSGFNDSGLDRSVDTAETTPYGASDKSYLPGLRDTKSSIKGNFSSTHAKKFEAMLGSTAGYFIYAPESTNTGRRKYKGAVIIDSYKVASPIGDKVSLEVGFQWSGTVTSTNW